MNARIPTPAQLHIGSECEARHNPETGAITIRGAASKKTEIDLNDWILGSPSNRCVWGVDKLRGVWRVGLSVSTDGMQFERLPCGSSDTYAGAVANAIEIARLAGYG